MKAFTATQLFLVLMCFATPARALEQPSAGPLMHASREEGRRLAALPRDVSAVVQSEDRKYGWSGVTGLAPGTKILVEVRGGLAASRIFVKADDSELIVRDLDVLQRIPRPDIVAITMPPQRRGSLIGAAIGAGGGFILGFASAVHFAYKQCNGSCSDEKAFMALSLVGFPVAGGLLGYQVNARTTQRVIYRAPTPQSAK